MATAIPVVTCGFCGVRQAATESGCQGCGATLAVRGDGQEATQRLLEMSTRMNALLRRQAAVERGESRRFRLGLCVAAVSIFLIAVVWANTLSGLGVTTYDSVGAAKAAAEARRREVELQMMIDQGW